MAVSSINGIVPDVSDWTGGSIEDAPQEEREQYARGLDYFTGKRNLEEDLATLAALLKDYQGALGEGSDDTVEVSDVRAKLLARAQGFEEGIASMSSFMSMLEDKDHPGWTGKLARTVHPSVKEAALAKAEGV